MSSSPTSRYGCSVTALTYLWTGEEAYFVGHIIFTRVSFLGSDLYCNHLGVYKH